MVETENIKKIKQNITKLIMMMMFTIKTIDQLLSLLSESITVDQLTVLLNITKSQAIA